MTVYQRTSISAQNTRNLSETSPSRGSHDQARRNHHRENRIREEIIVDAYGPEEQAMGWYCYLEDKIQFPFHAQCIASLPTSPLRKGDSVEIRKMVSAL